MAEASDPVGDPLTEREPTGVAALQITLVVLLVLGGVGVLAVAVFVVGMISGF
jgi:hypothetical protein